MGALGPGAESGLEQQRSACRQALVCALHIAPGACHSDLAAAGSLAHALSLPRPAFPPPFRRQQGQGLLPPGTAFDLFRGTATSARDEVETYPTQVRDVLWRGLCRLL